jgi:multiple sugar transport system substrate-binding protein
MINYTTGDNMNVSMKTSSVHLYWLLLALVALLAGCQPAPTLNPGATPTGSVTPAAPTRATDSPPTPTPLPTIAPTPTSALEALEGGARGAQVRFWHPWGGTAGEAVDDLVRRFNGSNTWGIWVQAQRYPGLDSLNTELEAALESQTPPDLAVAYPFRALEWEQHTSLVRLDAYVQDPKFGYSPAEQDDFYPIFWQQDTLVDERFGLPAFRSGQLVYYNLSLARELGYESPPANQAQFRHQACAAAQALQQQGGSENAGKGGYLMSLNYAAMLGWMSASGAEIEASAGGYQFASPGAAESLSFLRGLYDSGCAWVAEGQSLETEFALGRALFVDGSMTGIANQITVLQRTGQEGVQWTVLPFPHSGRAEEHQNTIQVYGPAFVMFPSEPPRQLAAWLFLKWMLEPENHAAFVRASASFPLRASALPHLTNQPDQWQAAVDLLPLARVEPVQPSWGLVRWSLYDASTQLFRYYFTSDQIPALVTLLDETAAGLHAGFEP